MTLWFTLSQQCPILKHNMTRFASQKQNQVIQVVHAEHNAIEFDQLNKLQYFFEDPDNVCDDEQHARLHELHHIWEAYRIEVFVPSEGRIAFKVFNLLWLFVFAFMAHHPTSTILECAFRLQSMT